MTTVQAKNLPDINIVDETVNQMLYAKHKTSDKDCNINNNALTTSSSLVAEAHWKVLPQAITAAMGKSFIPWVENHDATFGVTIKKINHQQCKPNGNNGSLHNPPNRPHTDYELISWVEELDNDNIIQPKRKVIYRISSECNNGTPPSSKFDIQKPAKNEISINITNSDHTLLKLTCIKYQNNQKPDAFNSNINWAISDIPQRLNLTGGQYELCYIHMD